MLQSIRDQTQGWIAGVIISLLIVSFALWGIHSYFVGGGNTNIIAKVNGVDITKGQLAETYDRMRRQLQMQLNSTSELSEKIESDLKKQALQSLITLQVLKQASLHQDYRLSVNQLDDYLEHIPDFQANGQFSISRFKQILATTMLSVEDFLEMVKTSLLIDQPRLGMIFSSFALPDEVINTYSLVGQERNIDYSLLSFDTFSKQPIVISTDKIQAYYKQHEDEFRTAEQVSIEYILLTVNDLLAKIQPTDEALKSLYNENSSSYSEPMRWKLDGILVPVANNPTQSQVATAEKTANEIQNKAKNGADFAILIQANPLTKKADDKRLGDWITLNQVPNGWQSAMLTLTKPGQITDLIKTAQGIVILKAIAIQDAKVQPYEKVKDKVKETYTRQQAEEKFAELKEKLASLTYEHPETLETAAKELGLTIKKSELFTKDKAGKDISANPKVRDIAFSNEVLNQQNNSDVIQMSPDTIMVLRVNSHTPATLLPLNVVEKQIEEKLTKNEVEINTLQIAQEIKNKLQSGASLADITQQYKLSWNKIGFIGRQSNKVDSAILNTAFEMPQPETGKLNFAVAKAAQGYVVIILNAAHDGVLASTDKQQYKLFAEQVQNTQGLLEYELYKQSQTNRAKIVLDNN